MESVGTPQEARFSAGHQRRQESMSNTRWKTLLAVAMTLGCGGGGSEPAGTSSPPPPASTTPLTIARFAASPSRITSDGTTTLTWSITGAQSVSIDHGIGAVTGNSVTVAPGVSTTYTLTATSAVGTSARAATTVTVT